MSNDFLSENNVCGQTILRLVSRGNAVIAELFRLSDYIPNAFRAANANRYSEVIFDFSYLSNQAYYDDTIEKKPELQDLDSEFKDNHMEILNRFYQTFESVHKYICDLNRFLEDLEEGIYIQQNIDTVLFNEDGKQLISEAIYLYGLMLLIIDIKFEGVVRERLLVSYLRYSAQKSYMDTNIDDVCKLLRSTGYVNGKPRPNNYPESYFARIQPGNSNPAILSQVIGRLRTDDIYSQMNIYPQPEHRSHALATQASMLYIILYFRPEILTSEQAIMREIVDKFFPDNWIISVYMGSLIVNLNEAWERYPAARNALANTITPANIKHQSVNQANKLNDCIRDVNTHLVEGFLTEEYLLTHINKATALLKQTNCTLKWLILHTNPLTPLVEANKKFKAVRDQILRDTQYDAAKLLDLALNLSQLEYNMKEIYKKMITDKQKQWNTLKNEAKERTFELSEVFSGSKPLTRIEKNDNLQKWFQLISKKIENLNYELNGNTSTGREITQLVNAIQEVLHYHEIDKNLQVKQFINDTANYLVQMISTCNIKEGALLQLDIISDISYAWVLIDNFTAQMQQLIKRKPKLVIKLRALFLKLSLALNLPLVRIVQSNSQDIKSVTQYYSNELVSYVRNVLQIIPESMFALLARIIHIQTNELKEVPTRLEKDKLKEYSQLDQRYMIASLTYSISLYTEGILQMKSTIIGYIPVEAKQLLEDGIQKELVKQITGALHSQLQFNPKVNELIPRLEKLNEQIDGYRRSFEYIQDYVNIYGLKIWQEEFSRIINFHVEQECNLFSKWKISERESIYQSTSIPIPVYAPLPNDVSANFIGRLAREIIRITDPKLTCYIEQNSAWYDFKTKQEIVNLQLFRKLDLTLDSFGLNGLDRLFSFMIVKELENISSVLQKQAKSIKELCESIMKKIQPLEANLGQDGLKLYTQSINKCSKLFSYFIDLVLKVGQLQLLRRKISYELHNSAKFDTKHLLHALETFNDALIGDIEAYFKDPSKPYPNEENPLLYELNPYLESVGLSDPLNKIYIMADECEHISLIVCMFVLSQLSKLQYVKLIGNMIGKKEVIDGVPLVIGTMTLLKQFSFEHRNIFLEVISQYIRSMVEQYSFTKTTDLPVEVVNILNFVEEFVYYSRLDRKIIEQHIPRYIIDQYQSNINQN